MRIATTYAKSSDYCDVGERGKLSILRREHAVKTYENVMTSSTLERLRTA